MRLGKKFSLIVNPVSWSNKGVSIRAYVNAQRPPNIGARLALAQAAIQARGQPFHLVGGIPYVAAKVAAATAGRTHGGMSADQKRSMEYASAEATVARLQAKLSGRGAPVSAGNAYF